MKNFLTLFLVLPHIICATSLDLVELYHLNGLKAVEKELEKKLQSSEYWQYNLKNKNISNGYYESIRYVMLCQKDLKDITLYDTKQQEELFSSSVFIGKKNGDKKKEGDLKTPTGVYEITKRLTKLDSFYGPLALTTNYPNIYDKVQGKTGHGIWIHGLPEKEQREDFTKGCIALDNTKIQKLDNSINIDNSILLISQNKFNKASKKDISIVLSNIFKWKNAWKNSNIKEYLSFYDKKFQKANGQSFKKFKKHKTKIFNKRETKIIKFSKINIIPYPNESNKKLFKVVMDEYYKTRNYKFKGKKKLYIELDNNRFSILTES